jgi:spoIIIJ-associated protein
MPLTDKVAAANKINDLLKTVLLNSGLKLKYKIVVNPPASGDSSWTPPDIAVDFAGPDVPILMERNATLMNSLETLAVKALRLEQDENDRISFDCQNSKAIRREELKMAADVAAEKVKKTGTPYTFAPMNSRERRLLHVALANDPELRTESTGEGMRRSVVVFPKDYKPVVAKPFGRRR